MLEQCFSFLFLNNYLCGLVKDDEIQKIFQNPSQEIDLGRLDLLCTVKLFFLNLFHYDVFTWWWSQKLKPLTTLGRNFKTSKDLRRFEIFHKTEVKI